MVLFWGVCNTPTSTPLSCLRVEMLAKQQYTHEMKKHFFKDQREKCLGRYILWF